jgi:hypothetical protein
MLKYLFVFPVMAALFFSACSTEPEATQENFSRSISAFKGHHFDTIVQQWGPPLGEYTLQNGDIVYQYVRRSGRIYPSRAFIHPHYQFGGWGGWPSWYGWSSSVNISEPEYEFYYCRTRFTVDRQTKIIKKIDYDGDICLAY